VPADGGERLAEVVEVPARGGAALLVHEGFEAAVFFGRVPAALRLASAQKALKGL
jgi:hypothetical protein